MPLARLQRQASLSQFRAWRLACDRWARLVKSSLDSLSDTEVADAAYRCLSAELFAELLSEGLLEVDWSQLLTTLRWKLGLTIDALTT